MEEDGAWLVRSRPLMLPAQGCLSLPMPSPVQLRGAGRGGTEDGSEVRANVAPGHASAAQAVYKATGPAL